MMKMKIKIIGVIMLCSLLTSCSTTKHLPEGEVLYTGIDRIEVQHEDKTEAGMAALVEVEAALFQSRH